MQLSSISKNQNSKSRNFCDMKNEKDEKSSDVITTTCTVSNKFESNKLFHCAFCIIQYNNVFLIMNTLIAKPYARFYELFFHSNSN